MKNIIKRFSLFLLCAICVTAFTCCFLDGSSSDSSQNSSVEINSEVSDSSDAQQESDGIVSSESSSETETPDSSVSSNTEEEDENELPRVPYKG